MTTPLTLTKDDLRQLYADLTRLLPPGGRPLTAEEVVAVNERREKIAKLYELVKDQPERGEKVFEWRVPRDLALTGNAYAGSRGWKKHKDRKLIAMTIQQLLPSFPKALLHGAEKRRWIRGTRFSTKLVDECALDLIGCKLVIDQLKHAGLIHDDSEKFLHREARQEKCKPGQTHLLVELFEMANEQVQTAEPELRPIEQLKRMNADALADFTKRWFAEEERRKATRCKAMSAGDPNAEDPDDWPTQCAEEIGHAGDHMAGGRGGTLSWR